MKKLSNAAIITMLVFMNTVAAITLDEFTPSLPAMRDFFHASASTMQFTVPIYMLAFAISQILMGPVSDRYGRRKPLLIVGVLFLLGSVGCVFAHSVDALMIARFVQGWGAAVFALTASALMVDSFSGDELNRASSIYSTAYSFIPLVAPVIGGLIQTTFGWRGNFVFLLLFGAIWYLIFLLKLPETHTPTEANRLQLKQLSKNYLKAVTHRGYILGVTCMVVLWSSVMVFSIIGPFVFQDRLGFTPAQYGYAALFVGLGFMLGGFANLKLLKKISSNAATKIALFLLVIAAVLLLLATGSHWINLWTVIIPTFIFMIGAGMAYPNFLSISLGALPEMGGIAASLIGSLSLLGATIITSIIAHVHAHTANTMGMVFLILALLAVIIYLLHPARKAS